MVATRNDGPVLRVLAWTAAVALVAYAVSDHPFYGGPPGFGGAQAAMVAYAIVLAASTALARPSTARALLVLGSGLLVAGVAEVLLEAPLAPRYRPPFRYDERTIWSTRPGRLAEHTRLAVNGGGRVYARHDLLGYRGDELLPRDDHHLRILVTGDSFVHALYSADDDTFAEQLERFLAQRLRTTAEVVNGGVASFGPDQQLLRLPDDLRVLAPDLLIVQLFAGNDFGDLLRNKLFRLDADGELVPNAWRLDEELRAAFETSERESIVKRALGHALKLLLPQAAGTPNDAIPDDNGPARIERWLQASLAEYDDFVVHGDDVVRNVFDDFYGADVSLLPRSEAARYRVRMMKAVLRRIGVCAREAHVPLLLLIVPDARDVAPGYDGIVIDAARYPDYAPRNLTGALRAAAEKAGVPWLDLFDVFASHGADELYFHGGDDHWNEAGQALAATVTGEHLIRLGVVPRAGARPGAP